MAKSKWALALFLLAFCAMAQARPAASADPPGWRPGTGHKQVPLWPAKVPDAKPMPGPETVGPVHHLVAGKPWTYVTNVSQPTLTVYAPKGKKTGAKTTRPAVLVFPGGGFYVLAMDLEGTEACDWLTAQGITCVLVKYRVPSIPYVWKCSCRPHNHTLSVPSLEDAQRAIRLTRFHARAWHIDPKKIGVIGFSAGGYVVAEASTDYNRRLYKPVDAADEQSARPDFTMAIYPGHLDRKGKLNPNVPVTSRTPPTFLVQAEDDHSDGVRQSLTYYAALAKAGVPVEMHLYAHGGHAFGLRHSHFPITGWPNLATAWMHTIGILGN